MNRAPFLLAFLGGLTLLLPRADAQEQEGSVTLFEGDGFRIKAGVEIGMLAVGQQTAFWNLGETFAPGEDYDPSPTWGEAYVKPYLTFGGQAGDFDIYGTLSIVASANVGTDVFDVVSPSEVEFEDAFIGIRNGRVDLSVGSQRYRLGTGMLLADGGGDGFERGAIIFGPRLAWEMTAIGRLNFEASRAEAFYLDPRELDSGDTKTTIAGAAYTLELSEGSEISLAAGTILDSEALWVQAAPGGAGPPVFIPNGRDGMNFITAWGNWAINDQLGITFDAAYENNDSQDMTAWGGRVQINYALPDVRFQPRFGYSYQTFSGDDPDTPELERFDPLFYDGSPAAWGSGSNASLVFLNSNVAAHQLWASATISPRDFFTARYYRVTANELLSPLQFGQSTRISPDSLALIAGVTDSHLSDDIYFEYTRVVTPTTFMTAGLGISYPGKGIRNLSSGERNVWTGGYVNLVMRF